VTYVAAGTTVFKDKAEVFDGTVLQGDWYYRVTSVAKSGQESEGSTSVRIKY
jgi:hypothetical protein